MGRAYRDLGFKALGLPFFCEGCCQGFIDAGLKALDLRLYCEGCLHASS